MYHELHYFFTFSQSRKDSMNKKIFLRLDIVALSTIILFSHGAYAAKMKCACDANYADALNGKTENGYTFSCPKSEQSTAGSTSSMSIEEEKIKFYIDSDTRSKKTSASTVEVDFRPRDGKCLDNVKDGSTTKDLFVGPYCGSKNYKTVSGITLDKNNADNTATAPFLAQVTGPKTYAGTILYASNSKTDSLFAYALCIEDK